MGHKFVNPVFFFLKIGSLRSPWYRWNNILLVYSTLFFFTVYLSKHHPSQHVVASCIHKKKSFNIHSHVRPKCPTKTKMSDQIVELRECWLSDLSDICRTFWEEYVGPESMIVDTLRVYCTVFVMICCCLKVSLALCSLRDIINVV